MWIDDKYISLISSNLQKFKRVSDYSYNFRCPLCGDSKKNPNKARGYLIKDKGKWYYYCHNCNQSRDFRAFIQKVAPHLYGDYLVESFGVPARAEKKTPYQDKIEVLLDDQKTIFGGLEKLSMLPEDHRAREFLFSRGIEKHHNLMYFCPTFKTFVNNLQPKKIPESVPEEERIVLPLLSPMGKVFGFQGRALQPVEPRFRYMTVMIDDKHPRFFGLDRVNFNTRYFVVEGPLDSLFLDNCIAACGGSLIAEITKYNKSLQNCVVVYDNEPRNKEIVKGIRKSINKGLSVVIWPQDIVDKDINDMVVAGVDARKVVSGNIYSGLVAELRLASWSKL